MLVRVFISLTVRNSIEIITRRTRRRNKSVSTEISFYRGSSTIKWPVLTELGRRRCRLSGQQNSRVPSPTTRYFHRIHTIPVCLSFFYILTTKTPSIHFDDYYLRNARFRNDDQICYRRRKR